MCSAQLWIKLKKHPPNAKLFRSYYIYEHNSSFSSLKAVVIKIFLSTIFCGLCGLKDFDCVIVVSV